MDTPHTHVDLPYGAQEFRRQLTLEYAQLFAEDPMYTTVAAKTSPEDLADRMTRGLLDNSGSKDGAGVRRTCKVLGIGHTYTAIRAYLKLDEIPLKG